MSKGPPAIIPLTPFTLSEDLTEPAKRLQTANPRSRRPSNLTDVQRSFRDSDLDRGHSDRRHTQTTMGSRDGDHSVDRHVGVHDDDWPYPRRLPQDQHRTSRDIGRGGGLMSKIGKWRPFAFRFGAYGQKDGSSRPDRNGNADRRSIPPSVVPPQPYSLRKEKLARKRKLARLWTNPSHTVQTVASDRGSDVASNVAHYGSLSLSSTGSSVNENTNPL